MKTRWLYETVSLKKVFNNLSYMLKLYGYISLPPIVLSIIFQEYIFTALFAGVALFSFLAGSLIYRDAYSVVNMTESLVIVALSYLGFSLFGAVPFLPVSSFLNGFFEAMSGFTTTGLTMFNPEKLPRVLVFFRSYSQWIGGAGIVILSLAILRIPVRTASRIASAEAVKDELIGSMKSVTFLILRVYLILTIIGYAAFLLAGMNSYDSLVHVLSGISTGGFSSHEESIGFYSSISVRIAVVFLMMLGAVNFTLYHHLRKKEERRYFFEDPQIKYLIVVVVVFAVIPIFSGNGGNPLSSFFHSASSLTTTGYSVEPVTDWPDIKKLLGSIQMIIGGGDGSTAGGIKLFRIIIIFSITGWFIRRSLLPRRMKTAIKYKDLVISNTEVKEIFGFFVLYLFILFLSTAIFTLSGHGAFDSFFESASSLGTVGLSTGITRAAMRPYLKLLLVFNMWAGRIEILPLLILFNPFIWKTKRRKQ
jgi:trk system potassium uptake protein TrkH